MTQRLFFNDDAVSCEVEVIHCAPQEDGFAVILCATPFHPQGGGQPTGELLDAINAAYPGARLSRGDVRCVYRGILPMQRVNRRTGEAVLMKHYRLTDHRRRHGWDGIATMVGVKYTTARDVAEKAVHLVLRKLGLPRRPSASATTPVPGGDVGRFDEFLAAAVRARPAWLGEEVARRLVCQ